MRIPSVAVVTALLLVLADVLGVYARPRGLHLQSGDGAALFFAVVAVVGGLVLLLGGVAVGAERAVFRLLRGTVPRPAVSEWVRGGVGAGVAFGIGVALTGGRRAAEHPLRWFVLFAVAVLVAGITIAGLRWLQRTVRFGSHSLRRWLAAALVVAAFGVGWVNVHWWVRLYTSFHVGLSLGMAGLMAAAAGLLLGPRRHRGELAAVVGGLVLWGGSVPTALDTLRDARPREALRVSAPVVGPWLGLAEVGARRDVAPPLRRGRRVLASSGGTPGTGPQGRRARDLVLVTVDALRPDALGIYGGGSDTPHIDALATDGVVFERAYTPTPHTSYALASLFGGTCARTAFDVRGDAELTSVAAVLRSAGHHTAAWFPGAIFHVDGDRFAVWRAQRMGFEHGETDDASAGDRVAAALRHLREVPAAEPVFLWVHLFEPHEPYDGDATTGVDAPALERYRAEVRRVDAAVGTLMDGVRELRPEALFVLTADHGEEFGEHGGAFHGTTVYEEQVRVPLIVRWAGQLPPRRVDGVAGLDSIAPTLLALAGVPRPRVMTGTSLASALFGVAESGERVVHSIALSSFAVSDGRHKVVGSLTGPGALLFDLASDAAEQHDLSAQHPDVVVRLVAAFHERRGEVAEAQQPGAPWEVAVARARVGDRSVAPEILEGLGAVDAGQRGDAARAVGELHLMDAVTVLDRMAFAEVDPPVRAEVALAQVLLGQTEAVGALEGAMGTADAAFRERAAFAMAALERPAAVEPLLGVALDPSRAADERRRAIRALGQTRSRRAVKPLVTLLPSPDLRIEVADALARIGDRRARPALARALEVETYPGGKVALERALRALGQRVPSASVP